MQQTIPTTSPTTSATGQRGRLPGQIRIRIRHRHYKTPWFDYLFVSPSELQGLIANTGWLLERTIASSRGLYVAVLQRT